MITSTALIALSALPLAARNDKKKEDPRADADREEIQIDSPGEKGDGTEKKQEPKLTRREMSVEINLCDGRAMKGKMLMEFPDTVTFIHNVDGLEFIKKVRPSDIRSIEFERWTPGEMEQKKNGRIFRFSVSRFRVELANSSLLTVEKTLPSYLDHFTFTNKHGNVLLYSYWVDLLKPDNTWYTGIQGPAQGERTFCHKDVVKKITFLR